ncbi:MAG: DUF6449 domain-containing protein [Eubacteriales bacterium]|nr:DUF6449 domain-containing protein [Eubacteriales bacterium]
MKSKIYSSDYIKTTSKGQIWIPSFLAVGFLMAFPVVELLMLGNWFGMNYESAQIESLYENLWRDGFMFTGFIVIALAALINGINGFWYLYSSRKIDFYHSLPVKRKQMFLHRTCVGVLYYLIPYLIMEFAAICIGAMRGFFSLKLMKMAVTMLAFHLIIYLMLYFCVVLIICMTGNILMGAVVLFGLLAYGPLLGQMISIYQKVFFSTFYPMDYGIIDILKNQGSPFRFARSFLVHYGEGKAGIMLAVLIILTAALFVGAYFAFLKRPSENVGKSMIYRWSEVVVRFVAVIPAGFGVGLIFYMAPRRSVREYWWIFGMAVGTVLAHGVIEVLFQMDFRKFFSHRVQLVIAVAAVAVCALTVKFDLTGYDTYLPAYEKLEGVNVALVSLGFEDVPYISMPDNEEYYEVQDSWRNGYSELDTQDVGLSQDIYRSLEHIISRKHNSMDGRVYSVPVKYMLKSGKEVYRNYKIQSSEVREFLKACYDEGTLQERKYAFLGIEEKYLQSLAGTFYDGETYSLFQGEREKTHKLIEALMQDVKDADTETMLQDPCAVLMFQYENIPVKAKTSIRGIPMSSTSYYYSNVYVYPGFKRTVALLKETGYPMSMEEVQVDYIKIICYGDNGDGQYTEMKYDSKEQLSQLKKCVMPYQFSCAWTEKLSLADFTMMIHDGRDEIPVDVKAEDIPAYVTEFIDKANSGQADTIPDESWDLKNNA